MKFNHHIKLIILWIYSLSKKFFTSLKRNVFIATIASLTADTSILVAFLLPLKILLLMGSPNTPNYFPLFMQSFSKESLILILSIISILFYLLHLFAQYMVNKNIKQGLVSLASKRSEAILFNNQDKIAFLGLERVTRVFSSLIFILLSWVLLGIIYYKVSLFLILYIPLIWLFFYVAYYFNPVYYSKLIKNINNTMKIIGGIGFLFTFIFIIMDTLYFNASNSIILMIIAFMLSRQVTNHYARVVLDITSLYKNQEKIDILFSSSSLPKEKKAIKNETFWNLCEKENRSEWIQTISKRYLAAENEDIIEIYWYPLEITDIVAFEVVIKNKQIDRYIIKLFNHNRKKMSENETNILRSSTNIPSLTLVAITNVESYPCHIFKKGNKKNPLASKTMQIEMILREKILNLTLSKDLLKDYEKDHTYVWDRLDTTLINRIKMAANKNDQIYIESFEKELPALKNKLKNLPLRLVNNFAKSGNIFYENNADPVLLNWGNYAIEPLGAGWPTDNAYLDKLEILVKKNLSIQLNDIKLSIFTYQLYDLYKRQLYSNTFNTIQKILDILQKEKG